MTSLTLSIVCTVGSCKYLVRSPFRSDLHVLCNYCQHLSILCKDWNVSMVTLGSSIIYLSNAGMHLVTGLVNL